MNVFWTSFLGPVAWLLAGSVLYTLLRRSPAGRPAWLRLWLGLGLLAWIALRLQSQQAPLLWEWHIPFDAQAVFGLQLDSWAWWVGVSVWLAAWLLTWPHDNLTPVQQRWLMPYMAMALLAVMALSWMNLLLAWALLWFCAGAISPPHAQGRVWTVGILSTAFLWLAVLWDPVALVWQLIPGVTLNPLPQLFVLLAVGLALVMAPQSGQAAEEGKGGGMWLLYAVQTGVALHLVGRFRLPLLTVSSVLFLFVVLLLGSSLAALADPDRQRAWRSLLINRSVWALWMAALLPFAPPFSLLTPLTVLMLGFGCWWLAERQYVRTGRRWPYALAFAVWLGLPLTPGFAVQGVWHQLTDSLVGIPVWLFYLLAQIVWAAAFIRLVFPERRKQYLTRGRFVAWEMMVAGAVVLWLGLSRGSFASTSGAGNAALAFSAASMTGIDWFTLLLPVLVAVGLARVWRHGSATLTHLQLASITRLNWLWQAAGRLLEAVAAWLGMLADVVDGAGQFGWVLLALLLAYILLQT